MGRSVGLYPVNPGPAIHCFRKARVRLNVRLGVYEITDVDYSIALHSIILPCDPRG